jgi:hypothetical protein
MLKYILIGVVAILACVLLFAATKPDTFRVERSIMVKAPAEKIFPIVNDFHNWAAWSPWEKLDLTMKKEYTGAPAGVGAKYAWVGNSKVGEGRMEITEANPGKLVRLKLDFVKPITAHNMTDIVLEPVGDGTKVTWAMYGPSPYVSKVMGVFLSMDSMIGKDFESGLNGIKTIAEKAS